MTNRERAEQLAREIIGYANRNSGCPCNVCVGYVADIIERAYGGEGKDES